MPLELQDGAIFIADVHANKNREEFGEFLTALENGTLQTPQLFLMGDIFDLLVGQIRFTCKENSTYIKRLDTLAKKFPIYYLEGNHDFNLSKLFLHVKTFSFKEQPLTCKTSYGDILLLHGDRYSGFVYALYTALIRSKTLLFCLNWLDLCFKNRISSALLEKLSHKKICKKIKNFQTIISHKIPKYRAKNIVGIVEGHYHQNENFLLNGLIYRNFSSFACDKSYFVVQLSSGIKFTQVKLRGLYV